MEQPKYKVVEADDNSGPVNECALARSFSFSESESEPGISTASSSDSDSFEEVTSSVSSSTSSSSSADQFATEPLNDMSSLFQQLPLKRGLSKYYQGKAESFTSLEKVRSLEDLVKPENPYNKKLKSCRSNGVVMGECEKAKCTASSSSCSENFMVRIAPILPHRSSTATTIPNQTALLV
ncbi:hypothetical protein LR48_Vigan07g080700 [Vigna angularis]|uniref:Oxidative stress 3 n=2 Tax=Phaseolus angularis TaxID=3914 RepID=A0A0L9UWG6_PHAAN|nr:protein OXIDATIVE STRESS 3 [Vigna angularis]KAG2391381.1 uncharacterized protein HKW66_Vig0128580 [Vigna angularis]KOM47103.1 hypothetical protein LR48_Vigan07g080700 [Vigna angularis]BAT81317.1 hypothetical protein VIGAN_03100800 [Vigna angularis var. angularis]